MESPPFFMLLSMGEAQIMAKQKCALCSCMQVEKGRDGKRRVFKRYFYPCWCYVRETDTELPYSMTRHGVGYFIPGSQNRALIVRGEDGESCPRFEPIPKNNNPQSRPD